ncbi:discoidin domain-containing protein [Amycolatopsis magusensis]|uniref:discoidin domain-containing protein n=1 Tax=Amycolatopsis magusensis TaxID=882444 RepID=UPI0024A856FB|nr:discoidin domain-containing protein [Amycolatopsis magusensis]MDI5982476.1 discoidin domain-containing protein [Amycolatopsis magusensis]
MTVLVRARRRPRATSLAVAALLVAAPTAVLPAISGTAAAAQASSAPAAASKLNDGDQDTYWESSAGLPQWAQLDLGAERSVDQVTLKLPGDFSARKQTLSLQAGSDGTGFSTITTAAEHAFTPAEQNTVRIDFAPTVVRFLRVEITANSAAPVAQLAEIEARPAEFRPLATTFTASSAHGEYPASNAGDGNAATYWESADSAFPHWLQADLGAAVPASRVELKLPSGWGTRTQTLSVRGSSDGTDFTDLAAAAGKVFTPSGGNAVTVDFTTATVRYVRVQITANTGWPAGQLSELTVSGPSTGDIQAPGAPSGLAFTEPGTGQIRLTWTAATDNVGVTGYDVYANGILRTSLPGTVLTHTDNQPAGTTIAYFVRARDAAGNQSANSNTVTRGGTAAGTNLAVGKPITASSTVHSFVAANANDDNTATYWEGSAYPSLLTVRLGSNADLDSVVVKLNPDPIWAGRTQTIAVEGREQAATEFTTLAAAKSYAFDPASGNSVTIPLTARVADVRLRITANSGAPSGQVAEFQALGVPAPNPDLSVTGLSWTPANPVETDAVTVSATVRNTGLSPSAATDVNLYLGTAKAGTAQVGTLAAGASATVSANIGQREAGSHPLSAKVDEGNKVIEQNEANNAFNNPSPLVVTAVASSDLVASPVGWTPGNPAAGTAVNFSVAIKNQGTIASAGGSHGITLTVTDSTTGAVVRTFTGAHTGTIAPGATTAPVALGSWPAVNGKYTVKTVLAGDANELPVKQANNTTSQPLFVGRGANMPYETVEAEDAVVSGGAAVVGPNRTIGHLAGEASGRRAVTLTSTGSAVEFTTKASTNTLVTRFSIPDAPGGGGITATLNIYVNGTFLKPITLNSKHAWLYGPEAGPGNNPGAGGPRHIYDEASTLLGTTVPAGSKIKLQKDAANTSQYALDFVDFEQVAPQANPDPARYTVPAGFTHQDVQNALDKVRMDTTGTLTGVYLPAGDYPTSTKFQVYGKAVDVVGAGAWFTRFTAPANLENTDIGFRGEASSNGSKFSKFAVFGNYTSRNDGPGKVFDFSNVSDMTIDELWVEHQMCLLWGSNTDNTKVYDSRLRDLFADGLNFTNGSTGNHVSNNEARSTGDDSFALFAATDNNPGNQFGNVYENLTAILPWRAAGLAVYGGYDNTFRNLYLADTLTYSAITISSLDFGYPMHGFGPQPTHFQNISVVRAGGHFWGTQTFPGIWLYSASKTFTGIRVSDVDIVDPTYHGLMFQTDYVGGQPLNPVQDTVFTNVSISGARLSGDEFEAKSGFGIWANELPEPGEGPAIGQATFTNLKLSDNHIDIRNTTPGFKIVLNP